MKTKPVHRRTPNPRFIDRGSVPFGGRPARILRRFDEAASVLGCGAFNIIGSRAVLVKFIPDEVA